MQFLDFAYMIGSITLMLAVMLVFANSLELSQIKEILKRKDYF